MDRLPPHSEAAERGVLGSILAEGATALAVAQERLAAEAFYDPRHREIWDVMVTLANMKVPRAIDTLTVVEALTVAGKIESVGGAAAVSGLQDSVPSAAHLPAYADIVADHWRRRCMLRALYEGAEQLWTAPLDKSADEVLSGIEQQVFAANELGAQGTSMVPLKLALREAAENIENAVRGVGKIVGIPTGLGYFDKNTGGLRPGQLVVLAARPGTGKTSIAGTLAMNMAINSRKGAGFFTMEMSTTEIAERFLLGRARVSGTHVRGGFLSSDEVARVTNAAVELRDLNVILDDTPGLDIDTLRAKARRMRAQFKVDILFVDYFQLMQSGTKAGQGRAQELGHVSNGFKAMAKELGIPVVVLAQLSREYEKSGSGKPRLSDIKDCGTLEQDADLVAMLYLNQERVKRMKEEHPDQLPWVPINLHIGKQRNGPAGIDCELKFHRDFTLFEDAYDNKGRVTKTHATDEFDDVTDSWPSED